MSAIVDIYCRVSSAMQVKDGYSLTEQEELLKAYAKANGWIVSNVCIDGGYSGKNMLRPGLQQIIEDAKAHRINKVLVYKMDRLSRSQKEILYLIEDVFIANNIDFVSMTENLDSNTPLGKMMIGMLGAFAQLEREQIKERMFLGIDARARDGIVHGASKVPIGYSYTKGADCYTIVPEDAALVRRIFEMYLQCETSTGIARQLNLENTKGRKWTASHITRILGNPIYYGKMRWRGELIECVNHTPIISEDTFNRAQAMLERRRAKALEIRPQSHYKHTTLLGGLLWCAKCGKRYVGYKDRSTKGIIWRYYCVNRTSRHRTLNEPLCTNKGWRLDELNAAVISQIKQLHADRSLLTDASSHKSQIEADIATHYKTIDDIKKRYSRLLELYELGTIDAATIANRMEQLTTEKEALEAKIKGLQMQAESLSTANTIATLDTFASLVDNVSADYMELYPIIHELIQSITLDDNNMVIRWNFE